MKLAQVIKEIPELKINVSEDLEIIAITFDSRKVKELSSKGNVMFVAIKGGAFDGHDFINQAIESGAKVIIAEREGNHLNCNKNKVVYLTVKDSRETLGLCASAFYKHPSRKLKVVGITGTNGKSTTAWILHHLQKQKWHFSGLIGTIQYDLGKKIIPASHTTPDPISLQKNFATMLKNNCQSVAMEVSSHAIDQNRCAGVDFDVVVFHNLTQDHLDYHGDMESYFQAKRRLFTIAYENASPLNKKINMVVNIDDSYGKRIFEEFSQKKNVNMITFGFGYRADFRAVDVKCKFTGSSFKLFARNKQYLVRIPLVGKFNVNNALAALASAAGLKMNIRESIKSLAECRQTPGRMQMVTSPNQNFQVFVDYAHTPDALEKILASARELKPRRLIVLFGAGGDRDRGKRALMGSAADSLADIIVITSDNPRSEDPLAIIEDIKEGVKHKQAVICPDRKEAIESSIYELRYGDLLIIAGKGHEDYQEIKGVRYPFNDVDVARNSLKELLNTKLEERES